MYGLYHEIRLKLLLMLLLVGGCAGMPIDIERPSLTITSINFHNTATIAPQFDIVLNITNPNRIPLRIVGMSYDLSLAGNKVISGVSDEIPVIAPYAATDVRLTAVVNLLGSIDFLNNLMNRQQNQVDYDFNARLDVGRLSPRITISNSGMIPLR